MTTMREVVEDAFEEIGVKSAEVNLTSDELQSGIRRCNDLLVSWNEIGYIKGYQPVLNGDDTLIVAPSAIRAIKSALAIELAPSYQKALTQGLVNKAQDSLSLLLNSSVFIGPVAFPDTLPMGSGNRSSAFDSTFFPANKTENF